VHLIYLITDQVHHQVGLQRKGGWGQVFDLWYSFFARLVT